MLSWWGLARGGAAAGGEGGSGSIWPSCDSPGGCDEDELCCLVHWFRGGVRGNAPVCKTKNFFHQDQILTQQHNWKKGSSSPRVASVFVSPSVILSVSKG
jgi:hypothetical protein